MFFNYYRLLLSAVSLLVLLASVAAPAALAQTQPPPAGGDLYPGGSLLGDVIVTTPSGPPPVDICLLQDETVSFADDLALMRGAAPALYDSIAAATPSAYFAVAGLRDYPFAPYSLPGDWVYRLHSPASPDRTAWLNGVQALSAGGGWDTPEAQYDAITAAAGPGPFSDPTLGAQGDCGWRNDPDVRRVLLATTDAPFHRPGSYKPHVHDAAATLAALQGQNIILVGLKASGARDELDYLAAATGGSVQPLSADGASIAQAILDTLPGGVSDVWWEATCDPGLTVSLTPAVYLAVSGGTSVTFEETVSASNNAPPGTYSCTVTFYAGGYPTAGTSIAQRTITVRVTPIPLPMDILPGSCPNPFNVTLKGVLPAAILGTGDLDVAAIDPATVRLAGVAPLRWSFEDVATPFEPFLGKPLDPYACNSYGPDGAMDLVLHFDAPQVAAAIGPVNDGDVLLLALSATLRDGRASAGEDVIKIITRK